MYNKIQSALSLSLSLSLPVRALSLTHSLSSSSSFPPFPPPSDQLAIQWSPPGSGRCRDLTDGVCMHETDHDPASSSLAFSPPAVHRRTCCPLRPRGLCGPTSRHGAQKIPQGHVQGSLPIFSKLFHLLLDRQGNNTVKGVSGGGGDGVGSGRGVEGRATEGGGAWGRGV